MSFGNNPTTTTQGALATNQIPLGSVAEPGRANGDLTTLEGGPGSVDSNGNRTAPVSTYAKDGNDVTQGTSTDANTANTVMGRLTKIRDLLLSVLSFNLVDSAGTNKASVSSGGAVKVDNSAVTQPISATSLPLPTGAAIEAGHLATIDTSTAASKTDLDTIVTNTNKIPASPATEGGNLATLAGIVSSSKAAVKSASGDFVDGSLVAIGTTTQTKATDGTTTSWSVIQLLKGIFDKLLGSIAVTGTFWQATQPVSGTVTANAGTGNMGSNLTQVAGNAVAPGNNGVPILNSAAQGYVAAFGSNAAALTSSTDYSFKWGAGGTTQVNHVMIQNNTTLNLNFELDATATAGSPLLLPGQTIIFDVQTLIAHLFQAGTPNVNGSSSGNIVVKGWL